MFLLSDTRSSFYSVFLASMGIFYLDVGLVGALPKTVDNCRFSCGLSLSVLLADCLESRDPKRFWIGLILLVAMRPNN